MSSSETELRSQMIFPPLQYGILYQGLDENMETTYEKICTSTNREGCDSHMLLMRDKGKMYDRLPTPVQDVSEPLYSSLLKDSNWKIGETSDIGQNPELLNKIEDISEKVDELRMNIQSPRCGCQDITSKRFPPSRCNGSNLSEEFVWGDKYSNTNPDSTDTDERYSIRCNNNFDYKEYTDNKDLVYNCTGQQWETKGPQKTDPFKSFNFSDGMIHCSSKDDKKDGDKKKDDKKDGDNMFRTNQSNPSLLLDGIKTENMNQANMNQANMNQANMNQTNHGKKQEKSNDSNVVGAYVEDEQMTPLKDENKPMLLKKEGYQNGTSPAPCSQNWFLKIFDDDNCSPQPTPTKDSHITITEVITWIVLLFLSVFSGYLIYKGGGSIPIYIGGLTVIVTIYIIIRFAL